MKAQIRLDTMRDLTEFVELVSNIDEETSLTDGKGYKVNAKSLLGAMYALEWNELYLESEQDIYCLISKYVII